MAVLGHAASAEDGSGFGRPGDQTGREVRLETLGADGNDWVWIYRYIGENFVAICHNIAEAMRQLCMNDMGGYSREIYTGWGLYYTRYGFWEAISDFGDIRLINRPFNCDCSSAVSGCLRIAGISGAVREMVTATEDQVLMSLGFVKIPYKLEDVLQGDVLWRPGHTGIVVDGYDGATPEPAIKYRGRITGLTPVYKTAKASITNILAAHPLLGKDNLVDVCDHTEGFYYVRIVNVYGYVPEDKLVQDEDEFDPKTGDPVRFVGGKLYVSSGGGNSVDVPAFNGMVVNVVENRPYPYYIASSAYDGWCRKEDLSKR